MALDTVRLAQALTSLLAPRLPYLEQLGNKAAEEAATKLGAEVWEQAKALWGRLRPKVEARDGGREAVADVAAAPTDADATTVLRQHLKKVLAADEDLARALARLLPAGAVTSSQAVQAGDGAIAQDGSVAASQGAVAVQGNVGRDVNVYNASPPGDDPDTLLRAYCRYVIEKTGHLSLSGIDPAVAARRAAEAELSLSALYTGLWTKTPRQQELADAEDPRRLPEKPEERGPASALELLDREDRLVLLGDPGSGKSTFISFVALCLAGEGLGLDDVNLSLLTAPMPNNDGSDSKERQPWRHGALVPVRVVLRDFAARGLAKDGLAKQGLATARDLWGFITTELEECGLGGCAPILQQKLRDGAGLLLLDGLDEVPEAAQLRAQILGVVKSFCEGAACRVVVTSRIYAYRHQDWRLPGFAEAVLAPFSDGQIRRFVRRWYEHVTSLQQKSSAAAAGDARVLEGAIFGSDRLRYLARRPLLLTLMSSLHAWRGGSLPERREELYADAIDLLLDFWERQRLKRDAAGQPTLIQPSLAEWLEVDREKVRKVLEELAYEAHAGQDKLEGTADLSEGDVVSRLMHLSERGERDPTKLMSHLRDRAGLLEPRGVGVYTFPHRTFQEYLAACHLTGDTFPDAIAELARRDPERWREVALLAGAKAARGTGAAVWHLASALCFRDPGSVEREVADLWGAQLAGEALVESADLATVSERNRPQLDKVRRWLVELLSGAELPVRERVRAGATLTRLGDPRFDPEKWYLPREPLLGFCKVAAGRFLMGSDPQKDPEADADWECPQHELELPTFYMARYPVTVQQYGEFVRASGYRGADSGALKGLPTQPVASVSWYDALAYCAWLGERLKPEAASRLSASAELVDAELWQGLASGRLVAVLPSEAEWEKAARGSDGKVYPWGDDPATPELANYQEAWIGGPSAVGCFRGGRSEYGCEEMSGNVWEWTRSLRGKYPYVPSSKRESLGKEKGRRVLRGGAFDRYSKYVRCASRRRNLPDYRWDHAGFRVALCLLSPDSEPSEL